MPNELKQDDVNNDEDLDWMDWKSTEEETREVMEQHYKEVMEEYNSTMVYDAGSGKKITIKRFEEFYGTDEYSKELVQAANINALYSKETAGKIKGMYAQLMQPKAIPITKSKVEQKPQVQPKPQKAIQEQFIPMRYFTEAPHLGKQNG